MRLQTRLILVIGSLLFVVIIVLTASFEKMLETTLRNHYGNSALKIAKTVASLDSIRNAFDEQDPAAVIQPIAEKIRLETEAEFIVVGNRQGIRYSHPVPHRIGREMVGGDNAPVLNGESIVSEAAGTLGLSLRGKTPVFDENNQVIGIVSVGFLVDDIHKAISSYRNFIFYVAAIVLIVGCGGAVWIANRVKRSILGLEPEEIGLMFQEKNAILESIHEGIVAINKEGIITLVNQAAEKQLNPSKDGGVIGKPVREVLPDSRLPEVLTTGKAEFDKEMIMNDSIVVVNRLPVLNEQRKVIGAVSSFRNKSELLRLTEELTQVKRYAEALRSQTHEYSNKLYMIYGLIQLESYQEAMDAITHETDVHQNLIQFLLQEIPDPIIGGILIGKFNRANELKVKLEIDKRSSFKQIPDVINRNHLVTIIGNLVDNALDAVLAAEVNPKKVTVLMNDQGEKLTIEIKDNGAGIKEEAAERLFEVGYTTKEGEDRGFGLALVRQAVRQLQGDISFASGLDGGSVFSVTIPKEMGEEQ